MAKPMASQKFLATIAKQTTGSDAAVNKTADGIEQNEADIFSKKIPAFGGAGGGQAQ